MFAVIQSLSQLFLNAAVIVVFGLAAVALGMLAAIMLRAVKLAIADSSRQLRTIKCEVYSIITAAGRKIRQWVATAISRCRQVACWIKQSCVIFAFTVYQDLRRAPEIFRSAAISAVEIAITRAILSLMYFLGRAMTRRFV